MDQFNSQLKDELENQLHSQHNNQFQFKIPTPILYLIAGGLVLGAVGAYFLDTNRGPRRRAFLKGQFRTKAAGLTETVQDLSQDMMIHMSGKTPTTGVSDKSNQPNITKQVSHATSLNGQRPDYLQ